MKGRRSLWVVACCSIAACGAPPPPPVVQAPPAPAITATPTATASAEAQAPDQVPPEGDPCEDQLGAVQRTGDKRDTMADCDDAAEATGELLRCRQGAETDRAAWHREVSAVHDECADAVATSDYQKLVAGLPSKEKPRHEAVIKALRTTVAGYCARCDPLWDLACVGQVFGWLDARVQSAAKGELVVEPPPKERPARGKLAAKPPAPRGKRKNAFNAAFEDLTRAICALPPSAWKDRQAPAGCDAGALSSLRAAMPPPQDASTCDLDAAKP